ncbi:hypothetical protein [Candidatus Pelagisphaera phototrophica]|uniref:hypothetical protein n=1 Tax=Candidatus Pelagisphaera phototrophica TaxID=2684113 RepID=UPI0019E0288A|nr:hypothetical protein [Candidatus Pelagisphaera phototrophica]QXD32056.1 hypothetical protein GA004_17430 [Candidatus Pelagisphaera phototrophica]
MESKKEGGWVHYKISLQIDAFGLVFQIMWHLFENDEEIRKDRELLDEITSCDLGELCRRQRGVGCCP